MEKDFLFCSKNFLSHSFCEKIFCFGKRIFILKKDFSFCEKIFHFVQRFFVLEKDFSFCEKIFVLSLQQMNQKTKRRKKLSQTMNTSDKVQNSSDEQSGEEVTMWLQQ